MSAPVVGNLPPPPELPAGVAFAHVPGMPGIAADALGGVWSCRRTNGRPRKGQTGRVRLRGPWKRLTAYSTGRRGWGRYPSVQWSAGRAAKVHHLVLLAFVGPRPDGAISRHLDDNPANCSLDNLAWGSHLQNARDKIRNGRQPRGERSGTAKLCGLEVALLRAGSRFASQRELARTFGVSQTTVWEILHGKKWRHLR